MLSYRKSYTTRFVLRLGLVFALTSTSRATVPLVINYQGRLYDPVGAPVTDGLYDLVFKIYDDSTAGNNLWTEVRTGPNQVQVTSGLFTVNLGSISPSPLDVFSPGSDRFLGVTVGTDAEMARVRLTSVPFAFQSLRSDTAAFALNATGAFLPLTGGTMTGAITSSGNPPITMGQGNFGSGNLNSGTASLVAGGNNRARGAYSVVCGGGGPNLADSNAALGDRSVVGGGWYNYANGVNSFVGSGALNTASGDRSFVGSGSTNTASGASSVVSGGGLNTAGNLHATVGGGSSNAANGEKSTISGGAGNTASEFYCSIGGGQGNNASGYAAAIGGGAGNSVNGYKSSIGGGGQNAAGPADYAAVGGGNTNTASGAYSTVPGGSVCTAAGDYSLAAGRYARANHQGCFVWADASNVGFNSVTTNEFIARATGGVRFVTAVDFPGNPTAGVQLAAGGGSWSSISDSSAKANVEPIDAADLLTQLSQLPIRSWNYRSQAPSIRHIGPMAQDFHALFGFGEDDRHITAVDADGVALAAIQELYRKTRQLDSLQTRVRALEEIVSRLESSIAQMSTR